MSTFFEKHEISQRAIIHEVTSSREIIKGIYTTGELGENIKEQALVLDTDDGIIVVTGCAHPGLDKIMEKASEFGDVRGAIGGFHGFNKLEYLEALSLIVPCHCTAQKNDIEKRFSEKVIACGAGQTVHLEMSTNRRK